MSSYSFHVNHNYIPISIQALMELISAYPGAEDELLIEYGSSLGSPIGTSINSPRNLRDNVAQCLRDFGIIDKKKNDFTEIGIQFRDLTWSKPALFGEIMHYLFFSAWSPMTPDKNCFSWSYSAATRLLWLSGQTDIHLQRLADDVLDQVKQNFTDATISFGERSIRGVLHWFRVLSPPVLDEQNGIRTFARRSFCPPELFLLAIDFAYRRNNIPYGNNLLLDPERQQLICELCLLEPEGFERVAGYTALQFSFLDRGMGGGWGSYFRLDKAPTFEDLK